MDFTITPSRCGLPTCSAAGKLLHSGFDPRREAERFIQLSLADAKPSVVILLGPCLDYLSPAIRALFPRIRIAAVQYDAFFRQVESLADSVWYPDSSASLDLFLESFLDEDSVAGIRVLEWEASARVFPEMAQASRSTVRSCLDRLASSSATVRAFGKTWIENSCASFLLLEHMLTVRRGNQPILVLAAGPSLGESLEKLAKEGFADGGSLRKSCLVISVSSALTACQAHDFSPDLVVATDAGYWSRLHLYPLAEGRAAASLPVLASPLSALPSASLYSTIPLLPLHQGSFLDSQLLGLLSPEPPLKLPPHGTVSGTALQLAARLSSGPIIFAGLDLASYGYQEHAKPHGFDSWIEKTSNRLDVLEGKIIGRGMKIDSRNLAMRPWQSSRSLQAYASALELDARKLIGRLFRLGPIAVPLGGFQSAEIEDIALLVSESGKNGNSIPTAFLECQLPDTGHRRRALEKKLGEWRKLVDEACAVLSEKPMMKGSPEAFLNPEVREFLRSIDLVDYAAARRALLTGGDAAPAAAELSRRADIFLSALEERFTR